MWQDRNARASIMRLISGGSVHSTAGYLEPPKRDQVGSSAITVFLIPYVELRWFRDRFAHGSLSLRSWRALREVEAGGFRAKSYALT